MASLVTEVARIWGMESDGVRRDTQDNMAAIYAANRRHGSAAPLR